MNVGVNASDAVRDARSFVIEYRLIAGMILYMVQDHVSRYGCIVEYLLTRTDIERPGPGVMDLPA
jgi:hypothetical protein